MNPTKTPKRLQTKTSGSNTLAEYIILIAKLNRQATFGQPIDRSAFDQLIDCGRELERSKRSTPGGLLDYKTVVRWREYMKKYERKPKPVLPTNLKWASIGSVLTRIPGKAILWYEGEVENGEFGYSLSHRHRTNTFAAPAGWPHSGEEYGKLTFDPTFWWGPGTYTKTWFGGADGQEYQSWIAIDTSTAQGSNWAGTNLTGWFNSRFDIPTGEYLLEVISTGRTGWTSESEAYAYATLKVTQSLAVRLPIPPNSPFPPAACGRLLCRNVLNVHLPYGMNEIMPGYGDPLSVVMRAKGPGSVSVVERFTYDFDWTSATDPGAWAVFDGLLGDFNPLQWKLYRFTNSMLDLRPLPQPSI